MNLGNGGTLLNSGTLTAGNGGTGSLRNGATGTSVTSGGVAVTLVNQQGGSIRNGVSLDNFANSVALQIGSTISGGLNVGTSTAATLTLTDDGTGGTRLYSAALSGTVSFADPLTKAGSGTWIIDQTLTFPGSITVAAGVLQIGNGDASGSLGTSSIIDNATLAFNRSDNLTVATAFSGSGGLTKLGANTLTLTGANTDSGNTVVNGGILVLSGGSTVSRLLRANAGAEIDYGGGVSMGSTSAARAPRPCCRAGPPSATLRNQLKKR